MNFFSYHLELRVGNSVPSVIFPQWPSICSINQSDGQWTPCLSLLSLQSCVCWMKGSSQMLRSEGSRSEIWHLSEVWEGVCLKVFPEGTTGSLVSLWRESQSKQQCTYASIDMEFDAYSKSGAVGAFQWQKEESPPFAEPAFPWQHPILPLVIYGLTTWKPFLFSSQTLGPGLPLAAEPRGRDSPNRNSKEISLRRHHQTQEISYSNK